MRTGLTDAPSSLEIYVCGPKSCLHHHTPTPDFHSHHPNPCKTLAVLVLRVFFASRSKFKITCHYCVCLLLLLFCSSTSLWHHNHSPAVILLYLHFLRGSKTRDGNFNFSLQKSLLMMPCHFVGRCPGWFGVPTMFLNVTLLLLKKKKKDKMQCSFEKMLASAQCNSI